MNRKRIVVVEDHELTRQGIIRLLQPKVDYEIIGQADNGSDAIDMVTKEKPDLVIMDVSMPGVTGIEAANIIHDQLPEIKILGLSSHTEKAYIDRMLEAGATGYVIKERVLDDLLIAIDTIFKGKQFISPLM